MVKELVHDPVLLGARSEPATPEDLHVNGQDFYTAHGVTAIENSIVHTLHGSSFSVNSAHHQAIHRLGKDLRATAYWNDTYIEAIEHTSLPIYGVQWHPERMCVTQKRDDTVNGIGFFEWFLNICKKA